MNKAAKFFRDGWRRFYLKLCAIDTEGLPRRTISTWEECGTSIASNWFLLMSDTLGADVAIALRGYLDALAACRQRRVWAVRKTDPQETGGLSWAAVAMREADDGAGVERAEITYRRALAEGGDGGGRLWAMTLLLAGSIYHPGRREISNLSPSQRRKLEEAHPPILCFAHSLHKTLRKLGALVAYPALRGLCALVCEHRKNRLAWLPIWGWRDLRAAGTLRARLARLRRCGRGSGRRGGWLQKIGDTEPVVERRWLR